MIRYIIYLLSPFRTGAARAPVLLFLFAFLLFVFLYDKSGGRVGRRYVKGLCAVSLFPLLQRFLVYFELFI